MTVCITTLCTLYNNNVYIYSDTAYAYIGTVYTVFILTTLQCNAGGPALMVCG